MNALERWKEAILGLQPEYLEKHLGIPKEDVTLIRQCAGSVFWQLLRGGKVQKALQKHAALVWVCTTPNTDRIDVDLIEQAAKQMLTYLSGEKKDISALEKTYGQVESSVFSGAVPNGGLHAAECQEVLALIVISGESSGRLGLDDWVKGNGHFKNRYDFQLTYKSLSESRARNVFRGVMLRAFPT